jgi:hypothetical protein
MQSRLPHGARPHQPGCAAVARSETAEVATGPAVIMRNWHRIGQKGSSMRLCAFLAMCTVAASLLAVSCSATSTGQPPAPAVSLPPDPHTASALLKIATVFNRDYDSRNYGPVYARWDARSQAIITGADYLRRHEDCPGAPNVASVTESVSRGPHGAWLVHYQIGGQQLTDYWFYAHRRWVFDLVLSNPGAVKLYRMSPQQYVKALGCAQ